MSAGSEAAAREVWLAILKSPGMGAIRRFNSRLAGCELGARQRACFLASLYAFNRYVASGIVALSARISDELQPDWPFDAHALAAKILDPAVDEYGLRGTFTHIELLARFAEALGVSRHVLTDPDEAVPAARGLGDAMFRWYRAASVGWGLGVHAASEATSQVEFAGWNEAIVTAGRYGLDRFHPASVYITAHVADEPRHAAEACECLAGYLALRPGSEADIRCGAEAYLELYTLMFSELTHAVEP